MFDMSVFAATAANLSAALKTFLESIKAISNLPNNTQINAAIIDLQQKLIEHQTAYLALIEKHQSVTMERDALKAELLALKQSKANLGRYELKSLAPGFSAYILKESAANGEPPHWLCPHCAAKGVIGLLQLSENDAFQSQFFPCEKNLAHIVCGSCHAQFTIPRATFNATWGKFA